MSRMSRPRACCHLIRPAALAVALLVAGCASPAPVRPARINHLVFFTLEDPADAGALLADCNRLLPGIPGVRACFGGRHLDTGRPTVDDGYDLAVYVGFDSKADYERYLDHPHHLELVRRWQARVRTLMVRDVLDETPAARR